MRRVGLFFIVFLFVLTMSVAAGDFEFVGGPTISNLDLTINAEGNVESGDIEPQIANDNSEQIEISLETEEGAMGYYGGVRYLFDNGFGIGLGYESQSFEAGLGLDIDYTEEPWFDGHIYLDNSLSGLYLEGLYEINDIFALRGAISSNSFTSTLDYDLDDVFFINDSDRVDIAEGDGLGYQVGGEVNYPVTDNLSILSSISYITGNIDIEKVYNGEKLVNVDDIDYIFGEEISNQSITLDYSGIKFALGVNYSF